MAQAFSPTSRSAGIGSAAVYQVSVFAADLSNGANGAVGSFGSYGILA
jgi:hypothetical protein